MSWNGGCIPVAWMTRASSLEAPEGPRPRRAPVTSSPAAPLALTFALAAIASVGCRDTYDSDSFTVVALPDTQYYSSTYPEILEAQIRWILANQFERQIKLVVHEGDIVDADEPKQWERAARSLHALDGRVPYVLSAGNHDYHRDGTFITRRSLMDDYFPVAALSRSSRFKGTFEPGHIENSFEVIDTGEGRWLVLSLEFGPRDSALAWADRIAHLYPSLPTIVLTHAYLASDDTRYDHVLRPGQPWNPRRYFSDTAPGAVNDGEEIWQKLVSKNDNILFVLCGHDLSDGTGRLTSVRDDGTIVNQLLANYQTEALGGRGYLRLMRFIPSQGQIRVQTYSPLLDQFKIDPSNDFQFAYTSRASQGLATRDPYFDKGPESTSEF